MTTLDMNKLLGIEYNRIHNHNGPLHIYVLCGQWMLQLIITIFKKQYCHHFHIDKLVMICHMFCTKPLSETMLDMERSDV